MATSDIPGIVKLAGRELHFSEEEGEESDSVRPLQCSHSTQPERGKL